MDFKDLSLLKKILVIIFLILISPLLLFCGILIIIGGIFEYPKYKRSRYFKKYKQKYFIGITGNDSYKIINYFENENINYDYFDIEKDELVIGDTTYLFQWFEYISFNEDGKCIIAEQDNYEPTLLSDDLKVKDRKNIKIIINENDFIKEDLDKARNYKLLLTYNNLSELEKELK